MNLLEAVGDHAPNAGSNSTKRMRLTLRIREAAARAGSGTVLLFCDEAQRYNEYEWLRDVHDVLDRQQIKLFTFLVGQPEILAQKTALQIAGKTQIVARLMVEEMAFYGILNVDDVARPRLLPRCSAVSPRRAPFRLRAVASCNRPRTRRRVIGVRQPERPVSRS
ncbi:hypothetical protein [Burkholderia ubonensis]|uniref:hypothetical protein n=1 Tax=Burkholderia ubonensis TaxID=101571 RepID=UPI000B204E4F